MRLHQEIVAEPNPEKYHAFAELAYIRGKRAEARGDETTALSVYGAAVAHAYQFLFDARMTPTLNPYDPQFREVCDLYNTSLEGALRILRTQGKLQPGATVNYQYGKQNVALRIEPQGRWHAEDFGRIEFVSDFQIEGLNNQYHNFGLGVPLIAVRRQHDAEDPAEAYYAPNMTFPVTAFLRVAHGGTGAASTESCVLELHDPRTSDTIHVANRSIPLETDLSTPLAYFLDSPGFRDTEVATWGVLLPDSTKQVQGIYMLEPYDPRKIPVLMVHGLWSSPTTWTQMFNDLQGLPEIRRNYQFWTYLYPTGQPFWFSAVQLRDELETLHRRLDPGYDNPFMNQMVLVGHSMGGLVSRLQTIDSKDDYWRIISDKPFEDLNATPEVHAKLAKALFFSPNPSVRRVVTIGTPHRGSEFANDYTRWIGRKLITLPKMIMATTNSVVRDNPGFFKDTDLITTTTSVDLNLDGEIDPVRHHRPRRARPGFARLGRDAPFFQSALGSFP